jgi:hypothetical protein
MKEYARFRNRYPFAYIKTHEIIISPDQLRAFFTGLPADDYIKYNRFTHPLARYCLDCLQATPAIIWAEHMRNRPPDDSWSHTTLYWLGTTNQHLHYGLQKSRIKQFSY